MAALTALHLTPPAAESATPIRLPRELREFAVTLHAAEFPLGFEQPRARAAANPDFTRSRISSRSNSAIEAKIPKTSRPFAVEVSNALVQADEVDTETAEVLESIHQLSQAPGKSVVTINKNDIHAVPAAICEQSVELWSAFFAAAHASVNVFTSHWPAAALTECTQFAELHLGVSAIQGAAPGGGRPRPR